MNGEMYRDILINNLSGEYVDNLPPFDLWFASKSRTDRFFWFWQSVYRRLKWVKLFRETYFVFNILVWKITSTTFPEKTQVW